MEIYFILTESDLMMRRFNFNTEILKSRYYPFYGLVSFVRRKVEIAAVIYGRGPVLVIGPKEIEFRLRPDVIFKALFFRLSSSPFPPG